MRCRRFLFGRTADNWFVSIATNYRGIMNTANMDLLRLQPDFHDSGDSFSPIGEEIFFRGFLQQTL